MPSLVSESVLQDVRDGAFFPMVSAIGISLGDVDLYVVAWLVGVARWIADMVAMERRPVYQRLEELHERGELEPGKLSPQMVTMTKDSVLAGSGAHWWKFIRSSNYSYR